MSLEDDLTYFVDSFSIADLRVLWEEAKRDFSDYDPEAIPSISEWIDDRDWLFDVHEFPENLQPEILKLYEDALIDKAHTLVGDLLTL